MLNFLYFYLQISAYIQLGVSRDRAFERLFSDIRPRQEFELEELSELHEKKMSRSVSRLEAIATERQTSSFQRKERKEQDFLDRQEHFAESHRLEQKRAAELRRLGENRDKSAASKAERRQQAASERAKRARAMQLEARRQREHMVAVEREHHQRLQEKHHGLSEWLKSLDQQKSEMMRQRKVFGLQSSLQRKAILQTTNNAWHETLRFTPLPEDPKKLEQLAHRMTPELKQYSR
eukprot:SAG31_NODE_6462_length_2007_cov_3.042977_2_plen_235_part_00